MYNIQTKDWDKAITRVEDLEIEYLDCDNSISRRMQLRKFSGLDKEVEAFVELIYNSKTPNQTMDFLVNIIAVAEGAQLLDKNQKAGIIPLFN